MDGTTHHHRKHPHAHHAHGQHRHAQHPHAPYHHLGHDSAGHGPHPGRHEHGDHDDHAMPHGHPEHPAEHSAEHRAADDHEHGAPGRGRGRGGRFAGGFGPGGRGRPGPGWPGPGWAGLIPGGPGFGPGFGPGGHFDPEGGHGPHGHGHGPHGRGRGRGPGGRAQRGDVRAAALLLLAEGPMHGYQLMQAIAERTGGAWKPSPGAVYPTLAQLEDEGLVRTEAGGGRKLATLTEAGHAYLADPQTVPSDPFAAFGEGGGAGRGLRDVLEGLHIAARTLARTGTPAQVEAARTLLDKARRELYLLLADGPPAPPER